MRKPVSVATCDRWLALSQLALAAVLVAGCAVSGKNHASETAVGTEGDPEATDSDGDADACFVDHILELVPLDIWGRDLDLVDVEVDVETIQPEEAAGPEVRWMAVDDEGFIVNIDLTATDYIDSRVQLRFDASGTYSVTGNSGDTLVAQSQQRRTVYGTDCAFYSVYLGLDHAWFAAASDPPDDNHASFMFSPQDYWLAVQKDLLQTTTSVNWSTWWWESNTELVRPVGHASMATHERRENTVMALMNGLSGTQRRVLINRFWDDNLDWTINLTSDADLLNQATHIGGGFEVILQGNGTEVPLTGTYDGEPAPIDFNARVRANPRYAERDLDEGAPRPALLTLQAASWHQKGIVLDSEVAFIGGLNTRGVDWDTEEHLVFDWRRMAFDASLEERAAVVDRTVLPDNIPRRDYGIRIEGPAAWDADALFLSRWSQGRINGDAYAEYTTDFALPQRPAPVAGGIPLQIVTTMPEPWPNMGIAESHNKAFSNAREFILIEDQFFRAPMVEDAIIARMNSEPDLVLIVVSMPVPWWDGGAKWSYFADSTFRSLFPERYSLFQLKAVDLVVEPGWVWDEVAFYSSEFSLHTKLRIVDDRYLSVGSCNMSNRSYKYDGELNVNVLDTDFASAVRAHLMANLVGVYWAPYLSNDPVNNLDVMRMAAEDNEILHTWWQDNADLLSAEEADEYWAEYRPSGFLYPLEFGADWDLDVGPDFF
jgi:phosphatidylserine/phosphatidylglycerophosphate/cardiolipin synthase-like enzyme